MPMGTLIEEITSTATERLLGELVVQTRARDLKGPTEPIIEARGLSVGYGSKAVLTSVSMSIPENRITALIGPSGCGKSTALRCFNRMNDEIDSFHMTGDIRLAGTNIYDRSVSVTALRRVVGMVFQHPNPFPMSIYDNIALAVREHCGRVDRSELDGIVEEALRHANLWNEVKNCLKDSAFLLSGGQQQRLCIARALAVKPSVIMLDEPCASLDPISTARIEELLIELSAEYTIIIVTHNLGQARRVSDDVAFFLMGHLVEYGDTLEVFEAPAHKETAEYVRGMYG